VLKKEGIQFEILNAKNHEREAHIISQAGRFGSVTLATNIAGRGVDILLGGNPVNQEEAEAVKNAGGLHILGTERHESRRIDNQLRGRAGRQGDPGSSQFFVSMEDDLMRLFGGERMKNLMNTLGIADDEPIEARLVSRSIEQAQKKIEGLNFDTRKSVLEFDDVLNTQRGTIYGRRRKYLEPDANLSDEILEMVSGEISEIVNFEMLQVETAKEALEKILERVNTIFPVSAELKTKCLEEIQNAADINFALVDALNKEAKEQWAKKEAEIKLTSLVSKQMPQA
jgi:preprotein translocase subunit SecA